MTIKFGIKNRFTNEVMNTTEIDCDASTSQSIKLGLAVKWVIKNGGDLSNSDISNSDLRGCDLINCNLRGCDISNSDLRGCDISNSDLRGCDLRGCDLRGCDLRYCNLRGCDLINCNLRGCDLSYVKGIENSIIDCGIRSDGYRFYLTRTEQGEWRIKAGCRNFTITEAKEHWDRTRPEGDILGDETRLIIEYGLDVANFREWK